MFHYISGTLTRLDINFAVVDCGGIGYKLTVSGTSHEYLGKCLADASEPKVTLYTHLAVREDDIELFGFATETELATFRMLITVSGVGPRAAMSILSVLSPERFALAVCKNDSKAISRAPGIGAKTAARIILELHDKVAKESASMADGDSAEDTASFGLPNEDKLKEAQDALMVLGYSRYEASRAIARVDTSALGLEDIIKSALKYLMK